MEKLITIKNSNLEANIKLKGAELVNLTNRSNNSEIIWNGDTTWWGRHAPVLFPFVGKLQNGQYEFEGKKYTLGQHGFARDLNFEVEALDDTSCTLSLKFDDTTLQVFPFKFELKTKFEVIDNTLSTSYEVINLDSKNCLFSIGAHPAFNVPLDTNLSFSDYEIAFEKKETSDILLLSKDGFISDNREPFIENSKTLKLSDELFVNDALIFDDLKSQHLLIQSNKSNLKIKVGWTNFPHLGIWKPIGAPFLCIEPWQGMADHENHDGNLNKKSGLISLGSKKTHQAGYSISLE